MTEPKRVLCIVSVMDAGGAETFLMKIYRKLDRSRYQMDFCVNVPEKGLYDDEIRAMGGRLYVVPCKSEDMAGFRRGLTDVVRQGGYQYVLRVTSNAIGFYDLKLAKDAGARRCIARSSNSSDGGGLKAWAAQRLGRLLYGRYVDVRLAPSEPAARYTFGDAAWERGEVRLLHNAVDLDAYAYSEEARRAVRAELGIGGGTLAAGHIGRFSRQKNHAFLLRCFAALHEKRPDSVLLLAGKGELLEQTETLARELRLADSVIFTGVRSDVPRLLSAMDVLVFPSLYEGMPNTVIEAQATGLPCIVSDTVTREADITGLIEYLPLGDPAAWAEAALSAAAAGRRDTRECFYRCGYDADSAAAEFRRLIFE